ncbi:MAG TPA: TonB-dependent receptor [Opitutus sp.]|nr:TonB-dependent receptor [Opitutus sp.]
MSMMLPISRRLSDKAFVCLAGLLLFAAVCPAAGPQYFDVPAGEAAQTLRTFSRQSGVEILYPAEAMRGARTRAMRGEATALAALRIMLEGTGFEAVQDATSSALVVKPIGRAVPAPVAGPDASATPGRLRGRVRRAPLAAARDSDLPVIVLSPFEVLSDTDLGYRGGNSVSATRMSAPIRQLPMTVMAFTESFIDDQKPYDLYDVVKWAPGVHQDNVSPQGWVRYSIRGFTSAAVQRNGFSSFRFIDTTNIERVEVVKGPASLLYGQINPGGVINYITKRPEPVAQLDLTAAAGTNDYSRAVVDATGPVPGTHGALLYRAIAMTEDVPQFQVFAHARKLMLAPSATWVISDRAKLTIDFEHFERRDRMPTSGVVLKYVNSVATAPYGPLPWDFSYAGKGDYQDFTSDALTAELTSQLSDHVDLHAVWLDSSWNMEWRATGQGGTGLISQSAINRYYPASAGLTPADAMFRRNRWEHQWGGERSAEIDTASTFEVHGVDLRLLIGAKKNFATPFRATQRNNPNVPGNPLYLKPWDLRNPSTWDRTVPFGVDALIPVASTAADSSSSALYGVMTASALADRLHVLAGFAEHELRNEPTLDLLANTATPPTTRSASVPQIGALFAVGGGVSIYANYSKSFLANTNMLRVDNVPAVPAEPSIGRGSEAGLKFDFPGGKLSGTLSAYRIRANPTDIVTITSGVAPDGTTLFTDIQGGSQLSQGVEANLSYTPSDDLQILLGFSRCHAFYEEHPANPAFDGAPLVATPDMTFSLWGKYSPRQGPLAKFSLAGGVEYVGQNSYLANNPTARLPAYTTVDLTLGYRFCAFRRKWTAQFTVKNLLDERYFASSSSWGFPRYAILSLETKF